MKTLLLSGCWAGLLVSFSFGAYAQEFHVRFAFPAQTGATGTLLANDGVLYGITTRGGAAGAGSVYRINPSGTGFTELHEFSGADGREPRAGLVGSGDMLYGTTLQGGLHSGGTVFRIGKDGLGFEVLKHFNPSIGEGQAPTGSEPLVFDGQTLYGMTEFSGSSNGVAFGWGTVFRLQADGSGFSVLKQFPEGPESAPWSGLALDGTTLYGTTAGWVGDNLGTVFRIKLDGSDYRTLWRFTAGADASFPLGGVVRSGSSLYGTTYYGPNSTFHGSGTVFRLSTDGTGFTTLHVFDATASWPREGLLLSDGVLYGSTHWGPYDASYGAVYALATNGAAFRLLKQFDGKDGSGPCGLTLAGELLYGVCGGGGAFGGGVLYSLSKASPAIHSPPLSRTAERGKDVLFKVRATGAPPLLYRLYSNQTNLLFESSTNTLVLPQVQPSQSGSYTIRVSNPFGVVLTDPLELNVIDPVPQRMVPGLLLSGNAITKLAIQSAETPAVAASWTILDWIDVGEGQQWYYDLAAASSIPRFYRTMSTNVSAAASTIRLSLVPAVTLSGVPGTTLRLDRINCLGPVDAWTTIDHVTLTNWTQLYLDPASADHFERLYRAVPQ